MSYGRWIAGGLGFWLGGPIGALIGYALGSLMDSGNGIDPVPARNPREGFRVSLVVLTAAVMKADGVIKKSELDFVRNFFVQNFGAAAAEDAMRMLDDIAQKDIPVDDVGRQIGENLDSSTKLQLLHFLYGIGRADGVWDNAELAVIERIARAMGISHADIASTKGMYFEDISSAYAVLEIGASAADDDVKSAYRRAAVKYHPDKVNHLGEDVKKAATERFRQVNDAYEKIKKARGMA
ncbi:MAG: TerB family tellurite resistance protein [Spirochaetota bacterium]